MRAIVVAAIGCFAMRVAHADPKQLHAAAQAADTGHCSPATCTPEIVALYQQAADAYAAYLAKSPDDAEARFLRAQILDMKLGRLEEAGDEYARVGALQVVGKYHEDALLGAIDAYDRARGTGPSASPIDDKLVAAANRYVELFHGGPHMTEIMFRLGQLAFDRGRLADAARIFQTIVTRFPNDPNAGPAGDRWLSVLDRARDWAGIERAAAVLRTLPAFQAPDRLELLAHLALQAIAKQAEAAADGGHARDAAAQYRRAFAAATSDDDRVRYLYLAATMLARARAYGDARAAYVELATTYPRTSKAAEALFAAARVDEARFDWDGAASSYEQLARSYPRDERAADALYDAGVLRRALDQRDAAIAAFGELAARYAARRDAESAALVRAELVGT
ncbi:MAG TPA: tetratricopeptide repeat protein, partial [Kofleriaceae bacterium]|nr:tetratricopeptide repeat protein [Kofleriaceae bacterium]